MITIIKVIFFTIYISKGLALVLWIKKVAHIKKWIKYLGEEEEVAADAVVVLILLIIGAELDLFKLVGKSTSITVSEFLIDIKISSWQVDNQKTLQRHEKCNVAIL